VIVIRSEISKNKRTQSVSIPDVLFEEIEALQLLSSPPSDYVFAKSGLPGPTPLKQSILAARHKKALIFLGIDCNEHKFYSWKHTGAVAFVKNDVGNLKELQLQLRHASLEETDGYIRQLGIADFSNIRTKTKKI
jgi:integrase